MKEKKITVELLADFKEWLYEEGKSKGTVEKYLRDTRAFAVWLAGRSAYGTAANEWKEHLLQEGYAPVTVNSMIGSLNCFFRFASIPVMLKYVRIQRSCFREQTKELSKDEFYKLIKTADKLKKARLAMLLETMGATGIRVSEVRYITVEAARIGKVEVMLKGKNRIVLMPSKLCRKLLNYARSQKIASGEIFITGSGRSMSRGQIWTEMKWLCKYAGIEPTKVFPHNLRHLFARTFYKFNRDVVRLADVLGHSSIDTTRIYLLTTSKEHESMLNRMDLVI